MGKYTPENYSVLYWRQCYITTNFFIQTRFPKTRTYFLCCNIVRNEENFGVLFFIIFRKQIFFLIGIHSMQG